MENYLKSLLENVPHLSNLCEKILWKYQAQDEEERYVFNYTEKKR